MIMNTDISMYAGFSDLVKRQGTEEAAKYAVSVGASSVELLDIIDGDSTNLTYATPEDAAEALKVLKAHGLSISCLSVGVNVVDITSEKPTVCAPAVESLKLCARIAAALEAPFLHHTLVYPLRLPDGAPSYGEVCPLAVSAAREVADYCLSLGVICLYEEQGMYFNGAVGFGGFFSRIRSLCKNVGVCGDIGNSLFVDESPEEILAAHASDIKHVHVKDYFIKKELAEGEVCKYPSRGGVFLLRAPVGEGDINIAKCLSILRSAGYSGAFAIEDTDVGGLSDTIKNVEALISENFV